MTSVRRPTLLENREVRGLVVAIGAGLVCVLVMAVLLILAARL